MTQFRILPVTLVVLAAFAGCSSVRPNNPMLEGARADYRAAQDDPQSRELAANELRQAGDAMTLANDAWARRAKPEEINHLAYIAKQRTAIAQEATKQKAADLAVANANAARDKVRLTARTTEADSAKRSAETAKMESASAQRQTDAAQRQSEASQRDTAAAQRDAQESQRVAEAAQVQVAATQEKVDTLQQVAAEADTRSAQLEAQILALNAVKTERGLVITLGDVFFDTNKAELKATGVRNVEKVVRFLEQNPQRKALVEGFTDSTGSESTNQELSSRRADAVRTALVELGVGRERIATRGYGESHPVASNGSPDGRQLNRRVEIILSDDGGNIAPR